MAVAKSGRVHSDAFAASSLNLVILLTALATLVQIQISFLRRFLQVKTDKPLHSFPGKALAVGTQAHVHSALLVRRRQLCAPFARSPQSTFDNL